jgi:predicted AlkP superfamily phosphohydrolase/phosphomutase
MLSPICKQVIVLGLDGATFDLIKPWTSQGKLPTFAKLMEIGAWGSLASTIPPHSPAAWSTFSTGVNPGKHGVIDFRKRKVGTYDTVLINGSNRHGYPVWKILSDYRKVVGVVNIPMTYPPEPVSGCFISGIDTPDGVANHTHPPDLASELTHEIGNYIIGFSLAEDARAGRYDIIWHKINEALERRIETVRYLLSSRDFDFFTVNFSATDAVQHHFWQFMDTTHPQYEEKAANRYGKCIYEIYKKLDHYLAEVWSDLGEGTILIVMSDHGFGPISSKALYLNNWLEQQGLLKPKNRRGRSWLRRYVPDFVKTVSRKLMPDLYHRIRSPSSPFFLDWSKTRAYADEYQECIWINLIGREPQGIVQPGGEYEELRTYIIEGLESLCDPETGLPVLEKVYRREDIYHGPQLDTLPDLHVEQRWEPFFRLRLSYTSPNLAPVRTLTPKEIMMDHLPGGVHRPNGIFLAVGTDIRPGKGLPNLKLIDLPATILHLLGVPVPTFFDGRVLHEILQSPVSVEYTSEYNHDESSGYQESDNPYNGQDTESVLERLRGLGYVD